MSDKAKRKVCYEELFDRFKVAAKEWLEATPEARGLVLTVDWEVGANDFPPAHMVTQAEPDLESMLSSTRQLFKAIDFLTSMCRGQIRLLEQAQDAARKRE